MSWLIQYRLLTVQSLDTDDRTTVLQWLVCRFSYVAKHSPSEYEPSPPTNCTQKWPIHPIASECIPLLWSIGRGEAF